MCFVQRPSIGIFLIVFLTMRRRPWVLEEDLVVKSHSYPVKGTHCQHDLSPLMLTWIPCPRSRVPGFPTGKVSHPLSVLSSLGGSQ